ncbi:MFS transporter [Aquabacterium sp. NJ1]|uniref:MFS transporter n=1 Tax=Aquabacterium sp. NJ1 TaxID=1538295 RepID=UPI00052B6B53|nr:MFS transporter [Aquabacterium sp. NJ1]KGM40901.1 MFS transporter [Aquabacterium sp. NJ1]
MLMSHLRELFAQTQFVRFWVSRLAGIMANQMLMVAVGWHMYDLTASAWDLGMVGLFQFVPALVMTLPAGQVADRFNRARIFAACMLTQGGVASLLLWATLSGHASRELILGLSVALGLARAFQMPAQQALTPLLVPRHLLQRAIAVSSSGMEVAVISGPALGGLLYTTGASTVYVTCTALLLLAFTLAVLIRYDFVPARKASSWGDVFAGLHFVWQRKVLLGATSLDLFAVLLGGATALLPIYAKDILHTGPMGLGLLRAAPAVGALSMSLVLTRWPLDRKVGPKLLMAVGVFGLATLVFGLSSSFWLSMVALAVTGAADNVSVVTRLTLTQLETPDEMRGRVAAVNSIFIGASNQLGEFESGVTAAAFGAVGSVVLGGVGSMLIALAWTRLFPDLAKRDRMT